MVGAFQFELHELLDGQLEQAWLPCGSCPHALQNGRTE